MRRGCHGADKFFSAVTRFPVEQLYKEIAFIAYYMHWNRDDILDMPHSERQIWCKEISEINNELSVSDGGGSSSGREVRIEDLKL